MHAFDRQTDRQTNGRTDTFLIASPRWHSMQGGNDLIEFHIFAKGMHREKSTRYSYRIMSWHCHVKQCEIFLKYLMHK